MARTRSQDGTKGNPEARRIADEAVNLFRDAFSPFAVERYETEYGPDWRRERKFVADGVGARMHSIDDPMELWGRLQATREFDKVFLPVINIAPWTVFELARDLKAQRNELYHFLKPWEAADSWRLVDRVGALIAGFGLRVGTTQEQLGDLAKQAAAIVAGDRSSEIDLLRREHAEAIISTTAYADVGASPPRTEPGS